METDRSRGMYNMCGNDVILVYRTVFFPKRILWPRRKVACAEFLPKVSPTGPRPGALEPLSTARAE